MNYQSLWYPFRQLPRFCCLQYDPDLVRSFNIISPDVYTSLIITTVTESQLLHVGQEIYA